MTPETDDLLRLRDVLSRVPFKAAKLYRMAASGEFPKQFHIGGGAFWSRKEVDDWIAARLAERRSNAA